MSRKWKPKKQRNHIWFSISPKIAFMHCGRCGLINLRNRITQRAVDRPCPGLEDEDTQ